MIECFRIIISFIVERKIAILVYLLNKTCINNCIIRGKRALRIKKLEGVKPPGFEQLGVESVLYKC